MTWLQKIRFFPLMAFYPFLLPIWQETYFRIENTSYQLPRAIDDDSLHAQRNFFFSVPDPTIRSRIILTLSDCENPKMQSILEEMLDKEKHPIVRSDIAKIIVNKNLKYSNISALKEMMKSEIQSLRAYSAYLYIDSTNSHDFIFEFLQNESSNFVAKLLWEKIYSQKERYNASQLNSLFPKIPSFQRPFLLKLLAAISKEPKNEPQIKDKIEKGSTEEKIAIAEAVAKRIGCADEILAKFANSDDSRIRTVVAKSVASPGRLDFLLKLSTDEIPEIRKLAVHSLSKFGRDVKPAISAIIARLADEDLLVRTEAEDSLILLNISLEYLATIHSEQLKNDNGTASAIRVLGELKYLEAAEDIRTILLETESVEVRKRALIALGKLNHKIACKDCASFYNDKAESVRQALAFALGQFNEKDSYEIIAKLAQDKIPEVSAEASFAIYKTADPFFEKTILSSLKRVSESYLIRSAATKAASTAGTNSKEIVAALRKIALDRTIPTDIGLTMDNDQTRGGAAWALVDIAKKNAIFANDAKRVLELLQTPPEKQSADFSSSEFLIDCAKQAEAYFENKGHQQGKITPSSPILIIRPLKEK